MVVSEQYDIVLQGTTTASLLLAYKLEQAGEKVLVLLSRTHGHNIELYTPRASQALYSLGSGTYLQDAGYGVDRSTVYPVRTGTQEHIHRSHKVENPVRLPGYNKRLGKELKSKENIRMYDEIRDVQTKQESVWISYSIPGNSKTQLVRARHCIISDTNGIPETVRPHSIALQEGGENDLQIWEYKGEIGQTDQDEGGETTSERYYTRRYMMHVIRSYDHRIQAHIYTTQPQQFTPDQLDEQGEAWLRDRIQQRQTPLERSQAPSSFSTYTLPVYHRGIRALGRASCALLHPLLQCEYEIQQIQSRYMQHYATLQPKKGYTGYIRENKHRKEEYTQKDRKTSLAVSWSRLPRHRTIKHKIKTLVRSLLFGKSTHLLHHRYTSSTSPLTQSHSEQNTLQEWYPSLMHMAPWNRSTDVTWSDGFAFYRNNTLGALAPYALVTTQSNQPQCNRQELLVAEEWTILIFDGKKTSSHERTQELLEEWIQRYTKAKVYRVTTEYENALHDQLENVRGDPNGHMHTLFQASRACIYCIRPDGHIQAKACGLVQQYQVQNYLDALMQDS